MNQQDEHPVQLSKEKSEPMASSEQRMSDAQQPWGMSESAYLMLMHLSLLSGFVIPLGGLILPLVMWLVNRDRFPLIDQHGKVIVNWMISYTIYTIIGAILSFVFIGVLLLVVLNVCAVVFVVMGSVKASRGQLWPYPLSINFLR